VHELRVILTLVRLHAPHPARGASSPSPSLVTFLPPDHGSMNNTGCWGGSATDSRTRTRNAIREAGCQMVTPDHQTHRVGPSVVAEEQGHGTKQTEHRNRKSPTSRAGSLIHHPELRRHHRDHDAGSTPSP
jgi:hypothetical protein